MQINSLNSYTNFKSSQVNILAMADNHGDFLNVNPIIKLVEDKKHCIFKKVNEPSTMNVFAIAGDYFMNTQKRGFLTDPRLSNGDIQYNFLQNLIKNIKNIAGKKNNYETLYTLGNHCFDGGDTWIMQTIQKAPMTTIMTNIDRANSPYAHKLLKEQKNVVQSKIINIPDDKSGANNHVLFLGVTIPTLDYYAPGVVSKTHFYNNDKKNDIMLEKNDLKETFDSVRNQVQAFKKDFPQGAIVVLSHTGNKISKMIAEEIPEINVILNGHDHKDFDTIVGKTNIYSLGQNNAFVKAINMNFDDNGKLSEVKVHRYDTKSYNKAARNDVNLKAFVTENLGKDLVPLVEFNSKILKNKKFVIDDSIRYSNNLIANYVTTGIKEAAKLKVPQLNAVGIPSTIFRSGLKSNEERTTFNNIDLIKMFNGVNEHLASVRVGNITGKELLDLILENAQSNLKSKTRYGIIQWSDIQINKKLLNKIVSGQKKTNKSAAIKIRNNQTGKFGRINPQKNYCILLSDKYLVKNTNDVKVPAKIRQKFYSINETYDSLFRKYLEMVNYNIDVDEKTLEERIIN